MIDSANRDTPGVFRLLGPLRRWRALRRHFAEQQRFLLRRASDGLTENAVPHIVQASVTRRSASNSVAQIREQQGGVSRILAARDGGRKNPREQIGQTNEGRPAPFRAVTVGKLRELQAPPQNWKPRFCGRNKTPQRSQFLGSNRCSLRYTRTHFREQNFRARDLNTLNSLPHCGQGGRANGGRSFTCSTLWHG